MYVHSVSDPVYDAVIQKEPESDSTPNENGVVPSHNRVVLDVSKQTETNVNRLLNEISESSQSTNPNAKKIRFLVDPDSGRMAIKVLDRSTDEVIREIPPENVLQILGKLRDSMTHVFDQLA